MKIHTTNYFNTFISVAEDCPAQTGEVPPSKGDSKTIANLQFEMISKHPYAYTSDDVLFEVHAVKNNLKGVEKLKAREAFFSKGQPCFRSSPLPKRYGWGVHYNAEGKIALYAVNSEEYRKLSGDRHLKQVRAMRNKK